MSGTIPNPIRIYHIIHLDRLPTILQSKALWSDAHVRARSLTGTTIGMEKIKERRLNLTIPGQFDIHVGDCVPFYFCPRSVMLYVIYRQDHPELAFKGGQEDIIHLVANFNTTIKWADSCYRFWAFTTSNAGSRYFQAYTDLQDLDKIDWEAVNTHYWQDCSENKQAEFLMQTNFPWHLFEGIGVFSEKQKKRVQAILDAYPNCLQPTITIHREWYY